MYFLVTASSSDPFGVAYSVCRCKCNMAKRVFENIVYDLEPNVKIKGIKFASIYEGIPSTN